MFQKNEHNSNLFAVTRQNVVSYYDGKAYTCGIFHNYLQRKWPRIKNEFLENNTFQMM